MPAMNGPSAASSDVDALFKLPLGEFTAARNALAAQLKKAGKQADAAEVKALTKPSVSAWAVNQLYWRQRGLFDRLIEAGDRLRRAQAQQLMGDAAREPAKARREMVADLVARATELLRSGNYGATRDIVRRVTATLEALSSYGSLPGAPAAGRLTDDVTPPGFEAMAGLLSSGAERALDGRARARSPRAPAPEAPRHAPPHGGAARRAAEERKRLLAEAKAALREAKQTLSIARKQAERSAARRESAAAHAEALEKKHAAIERQLAVAANDAEEAREHARKAAADDSAATKATEAAERALELAGRRLQEIAAD